jgi:ABC-2 type transport system permease protein
MSGESLLTRVGVSRISAALIRKDVREFTRDPSQWIPCCVMFGLLFLYSANLNRFSVDTNSQFWTGLVSYLNFGVCSLVVSTLATRFIFPLFSLEGRRLWILGLAPFNLHRVFWLKLLLFASVIALLTSGLMILSGTRLLLPWSQILHFAGGITLMSFGMTGLSLGLGVLFPNYEEANPAKIVSGYGGTLCLILNFLYILLFLTAFIAPGLIEVAPWGSQIQSHLPWLKWAGVAGILSVTLLFTGITIFFSLKRIKRLECLGKL